MNSQPRNAMENGKQPIHHQGHANAANIMAYFVQRAKIDFDQHGNDHHPNQQTDGKVDLGDFQLADSLEDLRQRLSQRDSRDDAKKTQRVR